MLDLRILGGVVVSDGVTAPLDIGIEGGVIVAVEPPGALGPAKNDIDATGLHVLPGVIDIHFHCRAPANPERADFATETRAALAGGVTTVCEMPISDRGCSTPERFVQRRELIEAQAFANVALYSGAALRPDDAQAMADLGAIAFKLFIISPPSDRLPAFEGLWAVESIDILDALESVAATGLSCVIHAESQRLMTELAARGYDEISSRRPVVEALGIAEVSTLAQVAGGPIHIAHVSSAHGLAAVRGARAAGANITCETCPQYLELDSSAIERHGGYAKIAPPLRTPDDRAALWQAIADGEIDVVASDHAPFLAEEKAVPYAVAPMGLPTVELLLPVLLTGVAADRLTLERAVELVTSAPAALIGLYPSKGTISPGADADIALVDLNERWNPSSENLFSRGAGCAMVYDSISCFGRTKTTILSGKVVYHNGAFGDRSGGFVTGSATK